MSYTQISVQVEDQTIVMNNVPKLASGGSNEVQICAVFDEIWEGFEKTAVFYRKMGAVYHVALDENGCAVVPCEVMKNKGVFYFGFFGEKAEDTVRTTEVVAIEVVQGVKVEKEAADEPAPDAYMELLKAVKNAEALAQSVRDDADAGRFGISADKIPDALKNPHALIFNGVSYDGSEPLEISCYTKDDIDAMFGAYVAEVDVLIGGEA